MGYRKEAIDCVKDHVLPLHKQIYDKYDGDFDRIYSEGYNSKSYQGRVIEPGKVYELSYLECSCPKVKCGLRSNPEQCECSRQSILYILSQLEPDSRFDVRIESTILRGSDRCTFRITRHAGIRRTIAFCGLDCEKCDAYIALSRCFETCGACPENNTCPKVGTIWQHNPQAKNNLESI